MVVYLNSLGDRPRQEKCLWLLSSDLIELQILCVNTQVSVQLIIKDNSKLVFRSKRLAFIKPKSQGHTSPWYLTAVKILASPAVIW